MEAIRKPPIAWYPSFAARLFIAEFPDGGHWRRDLTAAEVRLLAVYSYLIVYRPETRPLRIVAVLHAHRDATKISPKRV